MLMQIDGKLAKHVLSLFVLLAIVVGGILPAFAQTRRRPYLRKRSRSVVKTAPANYHTVSAGQTIRVRMNEQLGSETARIGDRFTTTTVDPVYADGVEVIPAGSTITGRVTQVRRAASRSRAGTVGVSFISLRLPNGMARAINGSLTEFSSQTAKADRESEVSGRSAAKRNVVFIGGGATTGALIGAIAGGGKGAGIGAGVGAGIGAAGAYLSKGHEAVVKPGTEFGVVLNQNIALPAANVR